MFFQNGVVFGPFVIMPFTIFSGFFLRYSDAAAVFRWMFHISFLKHGLVGLVFAVFGMDRPKIPCSDIYCHYTAPKKFIDDVQMTDEKYLVVILALIAIGFTVTLCSFLLLKLRLRSKW